MLVIPHHRGFALKCNILGDILYKNVVPNPDLCRELQLGAQVLEETAEHTKLLLIVRTLCRGMLIILPSEQSE